MEIERSITIARPPDEVFEFVAEPLNDPSWCPKVDSVERLADGRYAVRHRPIPLRPARRMELECLGSLRPSHIEWRADDGHDRFHVTYELERAGQGTRFTQRSRAQLGSPGILAPLMRAGIGRDVARQLRELRRVLERQSVSAGRG